MNNQNGKKCTWGSIPMEPLTQGTVIDYPKFDPKVDSEKLRQAIGADEKAITFIIARRSNSQRQIIKKHYKEMFGRDLIQDLKDELGGDYQHTVIDLLMPPADYLAYQCHRAIDRFGTNENCLTEIMSSRSNADLTAIRDAYKCLYGEGLDKALRDETSGTFKSLLISLLNDSRDETSPVDSDQAVKDAMMLYQSGEARKGADEGKFNVVLSSRSFSQLRLIFDKYENVANHRFETALQNEMQGDTKAGMLTVVRCARDLPGFFARQLYKSMKGLGTDDEKLIRVMVSRSEIDLVQIKEAFMRKYSQQLELFIRDDCSGDYKDILLQLCASKHA